MINENNKTIKITLSKKQISWLEKTAKKLKITKSSLIKFLIDKNIGRLISVMTNEELAWLKKIARTDWLNQ